MTSQEIRQKFLTFFEKRGHAIVPSASLVPENDPSSLFTTAGMQPLVPYLLGQDHPKGKRIVNVQKCVRTGDIDDVGDNRHLTFFEMMGNWSLGDYFKEDAIQWSYELLTSKKEGFGLDPDRLYITVFEGNADAPKDTDSIEIWKKVGIPESRIFSLGVEDNWWSPGENGPCGPDTEMFYDMTDEGLGEISKEDFISAVKNEDLIEIWNDVFMEYEKKNGRVIGKLSQKNVDTGAGLERITAILQGKESAYDTDLLLPIMDVAASLSSDIKKQRIISDHIRTASFMITDGIVPANTDRGYVLRRLIRKAMFVTNQRNLNKEDIFKLTTAVTQIYKESYPEIAAKSDYIREVIHEETEKFSKTLESGLREFEKGVEPFILFSTYGFPFELTKELSRERGIEIDEGEFRRKLREHQDLSRTSSAGMFKGGLANQNEQTIKLHTAHHLLLSALQEVLGKEVKQRGSNITEERLRIDFSFGRKLTADEIEEVEKIVNKHIDSDHKVEKREMKKIEAETLGAEMEFGAKYPDIVSIYFIEDKKGNIISKEFCGGPHVENTGKLGKFKIQKEEAVSAGVRRIKATLE